MAGPRAGGCAMDDADLLRYSRHILMPLIDIEGQQRLREAKVLVVGLGGLGSPAAMYLATSGVGRLMLADADLVEISNLPRQPLHDESRIGWNKALSASAAIRALNAGVAALGQVVNNQNRQEQQHGCPCQKACRCHWSECCGASVAGSASRC